MRKSNIKPLLLAMYVVFPSISFANGEYEGKSQVEINNMGKAFANTLNKGSPTGASSESAVANFGDVKSDYDKIANSTYNTNIIPTTQGRVNIQECTSMTQEEVDALLNSSDAAQKTRGINCDAVRTNEKTNDLMETRRIDPKKDSLILTFNKNQQNAISSNQNGTVSITCNTIKGENSSLNESCVIVATPTVKTCINTLTVACIEKYTNQVVTDKANHCLDNIGIDPSKTQYQANFDEATQTVSMYGGSGTRSFWIKDKDLAIQKYGNFERVFIEGWSKGKRVYFNGREIWKGKGSDSSVMNFNSFVVEGWNTLSYDSGGSLSIRGPFFQKKKDCEVVCNDVWDMACTEELMQDDSNEGDSSTDYTENDVVVN